MIVVCGTIGAAIATVISTTEHTMETITADIDAEVIFDLKATIQDKYEYPELEETDPDLLEEQRILQSKSEILRNGVLQKPWRKWVSSRDEPWPRKISGEHQVRLTIGQAKSPSIMLITTRGFFLCFILG